MKRCNACGEEFEDKFSFCPVDATPLNSLAAAIVGEHALTDPPPRLVAAKRLPAASFTPRVTSVKSVKGAQSRAEFHLTMIDGTSLLDRLTTELRFVGCQLRLAWPALKRDPVGFSRSTVLELGIRLRRAAQPGTLAALATAISLVLSAILILIVIGNRTKENDLVQRDTGERAEFVEFLPDPNPAKEDHGVGAAGSGGRVGFARGRGEGSAPEPKRSTGGGGGGNHDPLPAQVGKVPPPSEIPAPIPKLPPAKAQALPSAGVDIDPALWKNLPLAVYGDPRSKSTAPSNGPGADGGMGTGTGQGVGEGLRSGFGPGWNGGIGGGPKGPGGGGIGGSDGNNPNPDPDRIHSQSQVTERARVLLKPEPQYTEEARRNGITGSVVLRVVFSRTGAVTNIRALQTLPFGLTERAIMAARLIRFRPATKDGLPVNVSMQLEYNFNLY